MCTCDRAALTSILSKHSLIVQPGFVRLAGPHSGPRGKQERPVTPVVVAGKGPSRAGRGQMSWYCGLARTR